MKEQEIFELKLMNYLMGIKGDPLFKVAIGEYLKLGEIPSIDSPQKTFDFLLSLYLDLKKEAWEMEKQEEVYEEFIYDEILQKIEGISQK